MNPRFAGVELTPETIQATREHFVQIYRDCMAEAREKGVLDMDRYIAWREKAIEDTLAGRHDHSLTFLQRAHSIQTGECIALLP